jgi:hypothetical protein
MLLTALVDPADARLTSSQEVSGAFSAPNSAQPQGENEEANVRDRSPAFFDVRQRASNTLSGRARSAVASRDLPQLCVIGGPGIVRFPGLIGRCLCQAIL